MEKGTRRKLILDLDAGIDDALALAYALGSPEVELAGVVTTYGNVTEETAARNALALLRLLGHPEVPVYRGADRSLASGEAFAPPAAVREIHGQDGLGDAGVLADDALGGWCYAAPRPAVPFIRTMARRAPGRLLYVPTGPLTNLATALTSVSDLSSALGRVTFMGGALTVPGNVTPCAEANVHNDPAAADAVLRGGLKTRMVGLDVTHQVILTREDTARWRKLGTRAGSLFADMADSYIDIYEKNNPHMGGCALHDPLAVAVAMDPTLVRCLPVNLCVDLEGPTRGRTVCDPEHLRDARKSCEVAVSVDVPRFLKHFRTRVEHVLARAAA